MTTTRKARLAARRLLQVCFVDDRLDAARVRLVAKRLAQSQRRRDGDVASAFERLVRLERERHTAVVEAAATLDGDARKEIRIRLVRLYGAGLEMSFVRTPALIGGVRVTIGSDVYDGSVRAALAAIETRL